MFMNRQIDVLNAVFNLKCEHKVFIYALKFIVSIQMLRVYIILKYITLYSQSDPVLSAIQHFGIVQYIRRRPKSQLLFLYNGEIDMEEKRKMQTRTCKNSRVQLNRYLRLRFIFGLFYFSKLSDFVDKLFEYFDNPVQTCF